MARPAQVRPGARRRPYYLIPTVIGLCGILFAMQLPMPLRVVIVLLSAAVPAFVGGYMLATLPTTGGEKRLLGIGTLFLFIGAVVTASGLTESLVEQQFVPEEFSGLSRWIGTTSLFLGLIVMLFSVVRSGELVEELSDRFRHLASHMSEGFMLTNRDRVIVLVNRRLLEMTGLTERDLVGQRVDELAKAMRVEPVQSIHDDDPSSEEYQLTWTRGPKNRHFWLTVAPVRGPRGDVEGSLITVRDITEQHRLAQRLERYTQGLQRLVEEQTQKLRQSQEQLRGLLVRMREGFVTLDLTFNIRFANDRICEMLRLDEAALAGRNIFDFIRPDGRPRLLALLEGAGTLSDDERTLYEFTLVPAVGAEVAVIIAVAPVSDHPDGGLAYSLVVTDISELKTMQRELQRRADELQTVNEELRQHGRAKDTFLANVSHELRTPLSTIQGYVEMFESGSLGELEPKQRSAFTVMDRNISRLSALINEMINFSRMEIRGVQLHLGLLDARRLARECVGSAKPQALPKSLQIDVDAPGDLPPIWGDRQRLAQVLTILLSNAVKFTDDGGRITVRCAAHESDGVAFYVTDTGIGIAPAFQSLVFVKFFQVDSSKSRRYEGAGIGLSIAKTMVESHGGRIELTSEPGKGSTFAVILPRSVFRPEPANLERPFGGVKVLIGIGDDEFAAALQDVLHRAGCIATVTARAFDTIRLTREQQPDLLVLDEQLPDLNTGGGVEALRELTSARIIPILLIDRSSPQVAPELQELEGVRVVKVPFAPEELLEFVHQAIGSEGAWHPAPEEQDAGPQAGGVLLVSNDYDFLEWLDTSLRRVKRETTIAHDLSRAGAIVREVQLDAIVIDADSFGNSLTSLLDHVRVSNRNDVPLCVVSAHPHPARESDGGVAVLQKPFTLDDLFERLMWYNSAVTGEKNR